MIALYLVYALISASALLLMKAGLAQHGLRVSLAPGALSLGLPYRVVGGALLYGVSFLLWLVILRGSAVTAAFPVAVGLVQVFLLAGAFLAFHQRPALPALVGSALIVGGIACLGLR